MPDKIVDCSTGESRDATPEEQAAIDAARANRVPGVVTPLQIRKVLRGHPQAASIRTYFQNLTADQKEDWQFAQHISRTNPLIEGLRVHLGATNAQVDQLFKNAANEAGE